MLRLYKDLFVTFFLAIATGLILRSDFHAESNFTPKSSRGK
ncbi:MAG: hypothetical protein QNJ51_16775 [Calothrix sp. MO_167.B12]|nr:hypothetical protein [Calothrix sp. MO_167.B12]